MQTWTRSYRNTYLRSLHLERVYNNFKVPLVQKGFYLDIGSHNGIDASVFGQGFENIICTDINRVDLALLERKSMSF